MYHMSDLLDDLANIQLLEEIVSGRAVSVNVSSLSRILDKHRNTIKNKVETLLEFKIIDPPYVPFQGLYKIFPLLAIINMDIPDRLEGTEVFEKWVKEDPQIFAAFMSRQGEFDTLLLTYHKDITSYQLWMMSLPNILKTHYNVPEQFVHFDSSTSYFSNQLMIKYNPSTGINLMEQDYKANNELILKGYSLDELDLKIIRCLVSGKGIKINRKLLSKKTNLHRKTVDKRMEAMRDEGLISDPVCTFPNFFVPPNYLLTLSLVELDEVKEKVMRDMILDPCIPIALQTIHGKYNLLVFGNHRNIGDHLAWETGYRKKYPDSFKSVNITYLSPEMTISFSHQIVALCYLRNKLRHVTGDDLREPIQSIVRARSRILHNLHPN